MNMATQRTACKKREVSSEIMSGFQLSWGTKLIFSAVTAIFLQPLSQDISDIVQRADPGTSVHEYEC